MNHILKEEFSRQVFVLRKQVENHDALPQDLWECARKYNYSTQAVEQVIRDLKHRHGSTWESDRILATRCLERGKNPAEIIEGLISYGHQPEFAEKLLFAAQALKGKTEAAREAVVEEVLVEIKPQKRRRGLAEFLPSYRTETPDSLRAACLDLMWRLDKESAVNSSELSQFLLTADSKQVFGALMSLANEGKVKAFEVKGTKFMKFAPASKRMGFFSEKSQVLVSLAQMSKETGIGRDTLCRRLKKMTADQAVQTPIHEQNSTNRKKFRSTVRSTVRSTPEQVLNEIEPKMATSFLSNSLLLNTNTKAQGASRPEPLKENEASLLVGAVPQHPLPLGAFCREEIDEEEISNEEEILDQNNNMSKFEVPPELQESIDRLIEETNNAVVTGAVGGGGGFFAPQRAVAAPEGSETPQVREKAIVGSGWGF